MKSLPPCAAICFILLSFALLSTLHPDEPRPATTVPAATPLPAILGKWNVRVEVLMVALPAAKALALLPELRDDAKIDAAYAQLMQAIKDGDATLTGYPIVQTLSGMEGRAETNLEKVYPTQFAPPNTPTNFEKRNVGPELAVRCQVSEGGDWIQADMQIRHTELTGFDAYGPAKVEQPLFFCSLVSSTLALRSGHRALVGVHKLDPIKPPGQMELFILQAQATPAR